MAHESCGQHKIHRAEVGNQKVRMFATTRSSKEPRNITGVAVKQKFLLKLLTICKSPPDVAAWYWLSCRDKAATLICFSFCCPTSCCRSSPSPEAKASAMSKFNRRMFAML